MAAPKAPEAKITYRRKLVAANLLAGLTLRDIAEAIQTEFAHDPTVGTSLPTVHKDVKAILKAWRQDARTAIAHHQEIELMRVDRALNAIWNGVVKGDLPSIDRFIKLSERRGKIEGWEGITVRGDAAHPVAVKVEGRVQVDAPPDDDDQLRDVVRVLVEAGVLPAEALNAFTSGPATEADAVHSAPADG
jgi:hypothetical protein